MGHVKHGRVRCDAATTSHCVRIVAFEKRIDGLCGSAHPEIGMCGSYISTATALRGSVSARAMETARRGRYELAIRLRVFTGGQQPRKLDFPKWPTDFAKLATLLGVVVAEVDFFIPTTALSNQVTQLSCMRCCQFSIRRKATILVRDRKTMT